MKDPSVKNTTYKKVAEDYIGDLNDEINSFFDNEAKVIEAITTPVDLGVNNDMDDKVEAPSE